MDHLSRQERAILGQLAANPFAAQAAIAQTLGLARSTVAAHIAGLIRRGHILGRGYVMAQPRRIVCIGAAAVDRKYHALAKLAPGTSNPARGTTSFGGVARNVAENLARLAVGVSLITAVGADENGREILRHLRDLGIDTSQIMVTPAHSTAGYTAILDARNELALGIADMEILGQIGLAQLDRAWPRLAAASWVFADCNLPADVIAALIARAGSAGFQLAVDTVSAPKASRLPKSLAGLDILFINRDEAAAVLGRSLAGAAPGQIAAKLLQLGVSNVVLTLGADGALAASAAGATHVPPVKAKPRDVTGAGDAMIAGTLYRLLAGDTLVRAAAAGARLAAMTAESESTVLPGLSAKVLEAAAKPRGRGRK